MREVQVLKPYIGGQYVASKTEKYADVFDPSTGEVIARSPCCLRDEVEAAVAAAKAAYPAWRDTPVKRRADLMFRLRELIEERLDELTLLLATENGSVIFTQSGYYAREFARRTDGGMLGVNVGIPVPMAIFPFSGHKKSFFGDLRCHGKDAFRFFTESKCVTVRWFDEEEKRKTAVNTWDGSL